MTDGPGFDTDAAANLPPDMPAGPLFRQLRITRQHDEDDLTEKCSSTTVVVPAAVDEAGFVTLPGPTICIICEREMVEVSREIVTLG